MRVFFLLVLGGLTPCGCTTYEECIAYEDEALKVCNEIAREYARVDYLETVLKPSIAKCREMGGHSQWIYHGSPSVRMQKAINNGQYNHLTKMEMRSWGCCMSGICGLY